MTILTDQRLGTEPIRRLFVTMTLPVVLQQLLMLLNNVVDRIWIAHIPDVGQLAFTASGVCVPIVYMIMALAELTGTGISSRVGLLLGQGHHHQAERTLGSMMAFSLLLAMLTVLLVEVFCPELIRLFGGSPQTAAMAECYLRISTPGNAACIISSMLAPFLLVQGYSTEALFVIGSGIVINMILDPIFIFLFGWGIAGAAWATTVAEVVSAVIAIVMLARVGNLQLRLNLLHIEWRYILPCLALGTAPMAMMLAETVQMGVYNQTLYHLAGDWGVGTMALVIMLHDFLFFPVRGMAYGSQPLTSYNLGAGKWQRVWDNVKLLLAFTLVWSMMVCLLMMILTEPVVRLVVGDGPMVDYAVPMVRLSFVVFFVATVQFASQCTLQAMNRPVLTFWIGISRTLVLLVPFIWLLPRLLTNHADMGVFLAQPVTDVVVGTVTVIILFKSLQNYKNIQNNKV